MKKVIKSVFCSLLCAALLVPQSVMAGTHTGQTLYVNSNTDPYSFHAEPQETGDVWDRAVVQGNTFTLLGNSEIPGNDKRAYFNLAASDGDNKAFDVQGGSVSLQGGVVNGTSTNQTFKINAGSLNMTAGSLISMTDFQMKTNNDPSKSASVSLIECSDNDEAHTNGGILANNEIWIEKGTVYLDRSKLKGENTFRMTGGTINATGSKIKGENEIILREEGSATGGTITLTNKSNLSGNAVNMSAGTVSLSGGSEFTGDNTFAFSGGTISSANSMVGAGNTFNFTGGTLTSDTSWVGSRGSNISGNVMTCGTFNMTDGEYNVNGGQAIGSIADIRSTNALMGSSLNVTGGTININEGSYLYTVGSVEFDHNKAEPEVSDIIDYTGGTINLKQNGIINLAGNLVSNIDGEDGENSATVKFNGSNAVIDGNVSGVNLDFYENTVLSSAITGTISNLKNLSVSESKTLDIGTKNLNVTNADFSENSILGITIASKDSYGSLTASNEINITNGAKLNLTVNNGVVARDQTADFTLLGGTINGKFIKIAENRRYEFTWDEANEGTVHILGVATPGDIVNDAGGSENNAGTADAWGEIDTKDSRLSEKGKEVASILNTLSQNAVDTASEKAYIDALTAVAPDATPSLQKTATETANQIFGAVGTRLSGGSVSSSNKQGVSGGDFEFKNVAVWMQGLLNKAKYDTSSNAKNFDSNTYGTAIGIESYIMDDVLKAGVGYAYSGSKIDGFLRETDVKTNSAIIYGDYKPAEWFVNGVISYGWSDYDESKKVSGTTVNADWKAESLAAQLMAGYDFKLKNNYGVTPEAGLRYVHINQASYKDSADQSVSSHAGDILTGVIGGRINKTFKRKNGLSVVPEIKLAATYDLKNDDGSSTVTLANGTSYSVSGEAMEKFGIEAGAGVSADITEKFEVSLGYEGKFIKNYQDHTGLINFKYKF